MLIYQRVVLPIFCPCFAGCLGFPSLLLRNGSSLRGSHALLGDVPGRFTVGDVTVTVTDGGLTYSDFMKRLDDVEVS
jgi:hypothetical protein